MTSAPEGRLGEVARKSRVAGLVRQARRAGRLVVGVELTRQALRDARAGVALVAEDLSESRRDRMIERCRDAGWTVSRGWTKEELGEIAGKPAVAVLSVTDRHMAAGLAAIEEAARADSNRDREREEQETSGE